MHLEIITPEKNIYSGEVSLVNLPGSDGSFGILENHAPIISTLKAGTIKVVQNDKELFFDVKGGVIEMSNNKIIVLAE
ncbi:MAG: ATP synthase F1 subunit epsilon [Flavobacteriales bacterium]|jgi:F-type H+-transporting ATPase subunit epsilon|nr:ATP synthase F1 subunit epsilon [Flavobacteriales bacterium]